MGLAATTTPAADLNRIKANLEGIIGQAGPARRVVSIVHTAGWPGDRSRAPRRVYRVELRKADGTKETRTVEIDAPLIGQGMMVVGKPL